MNEPQSDRHPLLYGRRKGHPLSARRQALVNTLLPKLRLDLGNKVPADLSSLFPAGCKAVWLEIGFGGGEHLAWQANKNPAVGLIGVEPFLNGMANLLAHVEEDGLENIRLHDGDAQSVLDWLPEESIQRAFVLFPDPWPKKRHHKRRLLTVETLERLSALLIPGGELRIGTDIGSYASSILINLARVPSLVWQAQSPDDWRIRPPDWPPTRYEQKAVAAGRRCHYFRIRRR